MLLSKSSPLSSSLKDRNDFKKGKSALSTTNGNLLLSNFIASYLNALYCTAKRITAKEKELVRDRAEIFNSYNLHLSKSAKLLRRISDTILRSRKASSISVKQTKIS